MRLKKIRTARHPRAGPLKVKVRQFLTIAEKGELYRKARIALRMRKNRNDMKNTGGIYGK